MIILLPFPDVPASSSDSPLPPETGWQCGPGGGEKEAADRDRLSQVVFFTIFMLYLIQCILFNIYIFSIFEIRNRSSLLISGTMWTTAPRSSLRDGFTARTLEPSLYRSSKSELWSTNPFLTWRHGFKFHTVDLFSGLWHPSSAKREGRIQVSFLFYNWVLRSRCQRVKYAGRFLLRFSGTCC